MGRFGQVLVAAALVACTFTLARVARADVTQVKVSDGWLQGSATLNSRSFLGIPYAAPPVGSLRWAPPTPAAPWNGTRSAMAFGNQCVQADPILGMVGSEDCLYLNVITPLGLGGVAPTNLPVMVFIHGGAWVTGSGNALATPTLPTAGNVILVTINYRLGMFGFFAYPGLDGEGNVGLVDQQNALAWVKKEIGAFGGNPNKVTVFGESAGAYSICGHLASPGANGLFQGAIVESGPCGNTFRTTSAALMTGQQLASNLHCTTASCLLNQSTASLYNAEQAEQAAVDPTLDGQALVNLPFQPSIGGTVLPLSTEAAFFLAKANKVPLLMGSNHDEMRLFVEGSQYLLGMTSTDYQNHLTATFGPNAPAVLSQYPVSAYPNPLLAWYTAISDWGGLVGSCPELTGDSAAAPSVNVYAYEFSDVNSPSPLNLGPANPNFPLGAFHTAELPYLTHVVPPLADPLFFLDQPLEGVLSTQMMAYWTNFATNLNPNGFGLPNWPLYSGSTSVLQLNSGLFGIGTIDLSAEHHCSFWSSLPNAYPAGH